MSSVFKYLHWAPTTMNSSPPQPSRSRETSLDAVGRLSGRIQTYGDYISTASSHLLCHQPTMAGSYPNNPHADEFANQPNFELSDNFFEFDGWVEEDPAFMASGYPQNPVHATKEADNSEGSSTYLEEPGNRKNVIDRENKEVKEKVAFKTKSEVEILDDGFKWRKYGKKMVKNSPNPRNYYRCSVEGCPVKKRVERDGEDPTYVITTYEGIHNHQGPSRF